MFMELGTPQRSVYEVGDARVLAKIRQLNSLSTLFTSLYVYKETGERACKYHTGVIDMMVFDFDPFDQFGNKLKNYESMLAMHEGLYRLGIMHKVHFSGRGYHLFVKFNEPLEVWLTRDYEIAAEKKRYLRLAQQFVRKECPLLDGSLPEVDVHLLGNIAQLIRIPNTLNMKSKLFCIPLTHEELVHGEEPIRELAKKQRHGNNWWMGKNPLKINEMKATLDARQEELDQIASFYSNGLKGSGITDLKLTFDDKFLSKIPPCVANILNKGWASWDEFFVLTTFMKEKGMPYEMAEQVVRRYLKVPRMHSSCGKMHLESDHFLGIGCQRRNTLKDMYSRQGTDRDYLFPSCEKIKWMGLCPRKGEPCNECKIYSEG